MRVLSLVVVIACCAFLLAGSRPTWAQDDPYEKYVKTSKDFQTVKHDKDAIHKAFPSWTYMPWYYKWTIGFDDAAAEFCVDHGINGGFINGMQTERFDWLTKHHLRFYMDHAAGKGDLHLWDGDKGKEHLAEIFGTGVRPKPLNAEMRERLEKIITKNVTAAKASPYRAAYALDDEISWGHFVYPCMWQVTDDKEAFPKWLKEVYGPDAPKHEQWVTYDDIRPKLKDWNIAQFDASPLIDQLTFNDSYFNNVVGDLVEYTNGIDPGIPVGCVGGQQPSPFGGFDYAKILRKTQFTEAYGAGNTQPYIRSFGPAGHVNVTTFFYKTIPDAVWQTWYHLANGNKGKICWVNEKWFDGKTPKPWLDEIAPTWKEATRKFGPLVSDAQWIHDGVALYYSQASIQLGWIMDAETMGDDWTSRRGEGDPRHGCGTLVRRAWMNMLRDEGLQFNWIDYATVVQKGISAEYKVLILPATLCLSDAEARRIKEVCKGGGTVIVDYLPGLWDQHGKGRVAGGALDDMFGVKHDPNMKAGDIFGEKYWCETDQGANYGYKKIEQLLTNKNTCVKDPSGFNKAVRKMDVGQVNKYGKGKAVLMNLSPQWYDAYRIAGVEPAAKREMFMKHVREAGAKPWVRIKDATDKEFGYEIIYWTLPTGRTSVFLVTNPETFVTTEGGNAVGLKTDKVPVTLRFTGKIKGVRDERAGKDLGDGQEFRFDWKMNEAVVISFEGKPPRTASGFHLFGRN